MFPLRDNLPTDRLPIVTIALIALNVIAYLFLQPKSGIDFTGNSLNQNELFKYAAIPYELSHPGQHCELVQAGRAVQCSSGGSGYGEPTALTVLTSMFSHGGLLHLGGNMLFLWIFGNNVEDAMGRVRYLGFYIAGGVAALALQTAVGPNEVVPTLGASGAIAGVLGGYLRLYPRARVLTLVVLVVFFTFIEIPAVFFLFIWFGQQALFGALDLTNPTGGGGGVAYFAHIGGFAFGLLAATLLATRRSAAYVQLQKPR